MDGHRPATSLFAAALLPLIREMAPRYDFCRGTERERGHLRPSLSRHALRNETTAAEVATFGRKIFSLFWKMICKFVEDDL